MKDKKIFSAGLYLEGLRQLKGIGLILLAVNILRAIILYLGHETPSMSDKYSYEESMSCLVVFIAAILTCSLFSFLNRRSKSDFYHSIPYSRACLMISFFAAIFTWICIDLLLPAVVEITIYKSYFQWMNVYSILNQLVLSLYVTSGMMIACSITGINFASVILGLIVIFGPRYFITIIMSRWLFCCPIIPEGSVHPIINGRYSLLDCFMTGIDFRSISISANEITGVDLIINNVDKDYILRLVYSLIVILIYFIIAMVAFCRRNSETAEKTAKNKHIKTCFAITISMLISMKAIGEIVMRISCGESYEGEGTIFGIVLTFAVAICMYFAIQKAEKGEKPDNLTVIKGLIVLVILNVAVMAGMMGACEYVYNNIPKKEEVKSFSVIYDITDKDKLKGHDEIYDTYYEYTRGTTPVYDDKCVEEIIDILKIYKEYRCYPYDGDLWKNITIRIDKKNGQSIYRNIEIPKSLDKKIMLAYENDSTYMDKKVEDINKITRLSFTSTPYDREDVNYVETDKDKEIVDTFIKEYNALSDDAKMTIWYTDLDYFTEEKEEENRAWGIINKDGIDMCIPLYLDDNFKETKKIFNEEYMKEKVKERFESSPYDKKEVGEYIDRMYGIEEYYNGICNFILFNAFWSGAIDMIDLTPDEVEVLKNSIISPEDNIDNPDADILKIRFSRDVEYFVAETDEIKELINNHISEDEGE